MHGPSRAAESAIAPDDAQHVEVVNAQLRTGPYLFCLENCRFVLGRKSNWKRERERRDMAKIAKKKAAKPAARKTTVKRSGSTRRKPARKARAARKSPARRKAA